MLGVGWGISLPFWARNGQKLPQMPKLGPGKGGGGQDFLDLGCRGHLFKEILVVLHLVKQYYGKYNEREKIAIQNR